MYLLGRPLACCGQRATVSCEWKLETEGQVELAYMVGRGMYMMTAIPICSDKRDHVEPIRPGAVRAPPQHREHDEHASVGCIHPPERASAALELLRTGSRASRPPPRIRTVSLHEPDPDR